jgi:signal transduction histidine kinase
MDSSNVPIVPPPESGVEGHLDVSKFDVSLPAFRPDGIRTQGAGTNWVTSHPPTRGPTGLNREELTRINHEVRTPMNGILGFAGLLLETPLNSDQKAFARTIEECGHSLLAFWDTLLDLWTLEAADLQLQQLEFDPVPVIQEAVESISAAAGRKGLQIRFEPTEAGSVILTSDPARFRQTLHCLLDNALKFTDQGQIELSLSEKHPGWCRVTVADTGMGIPTSELERIFLPFSQVDSSSSRHQGGCGLGLTLARRLVELQGGTLGCESQVGAGSQFWFELPAKTTWSVQ